MSAIDPSLYAQGIAALQDFTCHDSFGSTTASHMPMATTLNDELHDDDVETLVDYHDRPPLIYGPPTTGPSMAQHRPPRTYGEPFITLTEAQADAIDTILNPVLDDLYCLHETTLPDYHPRLRPISKDKALAARLEPIAEHIREHLVETVRVRRGAEEMRLW
jgi:hypothetical protein